MNRSNKSKIAVTLLSALAFGANDASAMNSSIKTSGNLAAKSSSFSTSKDTKLDSKSAQTLVAVGGRLLIIKLKTQTRIKLRKLLAVQLLGG